MTYRDSIWWAQCAWDRDKKGQKEFEECANGLEKRDKAEGLGEEGLGDSEESCCLL